MIARANAERSHRGQAFLGLLALCSLIGSLIAVVPQNEHASTIIRLSSR
jgi:hypothetical protein